MKLYKDDSLRVYNESLLEKKKKDDRCNRVISALLVFNIVCNVMYISSNVKYLIDHANPFDGQRISSSSFSVNYKMMRSKIFLEDDSFKDIIESIKNSDIDKKKAYLLYYSLISNECLTKEEKKNLTGCLQYFIDNKYLDYEYVYNNLSRLVIKPNDNSLIDKGTAGVYSLKNNNITFANNEARNYALSHEVFHSESKHDVNHYVPRWFEEGLSDLLSCEYTDSIVTYDVEVTFCRILCEFVGSDVLFETRAKGDINVLINALVNKGIPKEKIAVLFELFDDYTINLKENNYDFDSLKIKIIDQLRDCYLDISMNDEFVNQMFYQYVLYISNLQSCNSNINYYFNSSIIKETGFPTFTVNYHYAQADSSEDYVVTYEKEYHDFYLIERKIEPINGDDKKITTKESRLTKDEFNQSIDGIINKINENRFIITM